MTYLDLKKSLNINIDLDVLEYSKYVFNSLGR